MIIYPTILNGSEMQERIQKILSRFGIASRRVAEDMILEGRVTVNGVVARLGMKADITKDHIKVDGRLIRCTGQPVYLIFNKPRGCITSLYDPEGRQTIKDYIKGIKERVYPVGRLDYNSEGLLLLTNDGELTNAILHPSHKIEKTYHVKVDGFLDEEDIHRLEKGIRLEDGITAPARVRLIRKTEANSWVEITIHEGRKRQIRRMFENLGHPVIKLKRIRINGIGLGNLPSGAFRYLTPMEVQILKREVMARDVEG
ncbi:MAG: pseudouridine synthase [Thermodesulfovibrionia bacterium]